MIVFGLVVGLIIFLLLLAYFSQREMRNEMVDDDNYVEPVIELEESEESENVNVG